MSLCRMCKEERPQGCFSEGHRGRIAKGLAVTCMDCIKVKKRKNREKKERKRRLRKQQKRLAKKSAIGRVDDDDEDEDEEGASGRGNGVDAAEGGGRRGGGRRGRVLRRLTHRTISDPNTQTYRVPAADRRLP